MKEEGGPGRKRGRGLGRLLRGQALRSAANALAERASEAQRGRHWRWRAKAGERGEESAAGTEARRTQAAGSVEAAQRERQRERAGPAEGGRRRREGGEREGEERVSEKEKKNLKIARCRVLLAVGRKAHCCVTRHLCAMLVMKTSGGRGRERGEEGQ